MNIFYPDAKNIKERDFITIVWNFQVTVESMTIFLLRHNGELKNSLRYKRLFFLRFEYRQLILKSRFFR